MSVIRYPYSEEHWALVNEFLASGISAEAAYRMGLVSTLLITSGLKPEREIFERAMSAQSIADVAEWFDAYKRRVERRA